MLSFLTPYACLSLATCLLRRSQRYSLPEAFLCGIAWPLDLAIAALAFAHEATDAHTNQ